MPELVRHALHVFSPRGPMTTRRMTAYWGVLAAAALTTLAVAAAAAAIAVFMGQALPLAVQHDLTAAPGTDMSVTALVNGGSQASSGGATLRSQIAAAIPGVPFSLQSASWSDPLGLVPGALPASPPGVGSGSTTLLQAASMSGIASHATLIAGRWPPAPAATAATAAPGGGGPAAIPAALPASAAKLLHVSVGDVLRLRDRLNNALLSFDITGVFAPRTASGPDDSYWALSYIPAGGVSASYASSTYGPLVVSPAAFGSGLTQQSGSWLAQPDMTAFPDGSLGPDAASVAALAASLPNATFLNGAQMTTSLPTVLDAAGSNLTVARSLLVISALQILVLAVVALTAVGRLLAAQREGETALLIARGATRWQLTRLTAAEVVPLSALVSVVGALAGLRLSDALVSAGALGPAGHPAGGPAGRLARRARGGDRRRPHRHRLAARARAYRRRAGARRQAGAGGRGHPGRPRHRPDRAGGAGLLAASPVLRRRRERERRDRSGAGAGARARARGRKRRRAAPASAGGRGRGLAGRPRPRAARSAGLVAVQPDAGSAGERGAAAGDGGRGRDARARPAPELDQVGVGPGQLRGRRRRSGRPARAAQPGRNGSRGRRARGDPRDGGRGRRDRDPGRSRRDRLGPGGGVVRLRGDETALPPASLFGAITPSAAGRPGAALPTARPGADAGSHPAHRHPRPAPATATAKKTRRQGNNQRRAPAA